MSELSSDEHYPVVAVPTYSTLPSAVEMQLNHLRLRQGLDHIMNSMSNGVKSVVFKQGDTVLGTITTLVEARKSH